MTLLHNGFPISVIEKLNNAPLSDDEEREMSLNRFGSNSSSESGDRRSRLVLELVFAFVIQ
ncbi:hypothetical protein ANCCAN_29185 [Ancylostoma caninum]|uniref:Uncharacterized protein n=1 Tax=Ancylostoma caninum TaxID=29170 RepID=A0A368F2I4_ANCCA|nr:hypothetical protein ANCCAN_29185 [Ancylostoma caninum]